MITFKELYLQEDAKSFLSDMQKTLKKSGFKVSKRGSEFSWEHDAKSFNQLEKIFTEKVFGGVIISKDNDNYFVDFSGDWKFQIYCDEGSEDNKGKYYNPKKYNGPFRGQLTYTYEAYKREEKL